MGHKRFKKPTNRDEIPSLRPHSNIADKYNFLNSSDKKIHFAGNFSVWPYLINILDSRIAALYPTTVLQGLYRFPSPVPANVNWVTQIKNLTNVPYLTSWCISVFSCAEDPDPVVSKVLSYPDP